MNIIPHICIDKFDHRPVGVAMGGTCEEREISLITGASLANALREYGHEVTTYDLPADFDRLRHDKPAALLLAMHGGFGEDGRLQGWLELEGIPYTGSRTLASALALDKHRSKVFFEMSGVQVPGGKWFPSYLATELRSMRDFDAFYAFIQNFCIDLKVDLPLVLKRNASGSSFGVTINRTEDEFRRNFLDLLKLLNPHDSCDGFLIERLIYGSEYSVGFYDTFFLGAIQIQPEGGFYDFQAKYASQSTKYQHVDNKELLDELEDIGRRAYEALGCSGVARVDVIGEPGNFFVLEVNTLPGMTPTSLVPKMAKALGIDFVQFSNLLLCGAR